MKKKIISLFVALFLTIPQLSLAASGAGAKRKHLEEGYESTEKTEKSEYPSEKRERSANALIITGYTISTVGGLAAIAGSIIVTAKPEKRVLGAAIGGAGLALGLAGGLITIIGYHKRGGGGYDYSIAPAISPDGAALSLGMSF